MLRQTAGEDKRLKSGPIHGCLCFDQQVLNSSEIPVGRRPEGKEQCGRIAALLFWSACVPIALGDVRRNCFEPRSHKIVPANALILFNPGVNSLAAWPGVPFIFDITGARHPPHYCEKHMKRMCGAG
jgi:hypothetical protein